MKKKQKEEMRAKTIPQLLEEINKRETEILKLRMEVKLAKVKNTTSLRCKRDELAQVKTILQEKKLEETVSARAEEKREK
ncbi:MAG TPA: 50S ribosomal protein L29 [Clostridia bacterium]|nr:50S ribosomal protein L29 [Clostridia bacterium]